MHRPIDHRRRTGQSMLEAIIATGIIVTAVSSALTLVQSSISGEKDSETSLIAANLAREGVEVVRAVRDSNWLAGRPWDKGLEGVGSDYSGIPAFDPAANDWVVDFSADSIDEAAAVVYRHTTGTGGPTVGLFVQAASQPADTVPTSFARLLTLDAVCDDGLGGHTVVTSGTSCGAQEKIGIRAASEVRWLSSGRPRTIVVEEMLFNWR